MNKQTLPAGLEDSNLEIYSMNNVLMSLYNGEKIEFWKLPEYIIEEFRLAMIADTKKYKILKSLFSDEKLMLSKYIFCNFGGFNLDPDYTTDGIFHPEYWNCGKRGICKYDGKICVKLSEDYTNPTCKELSIIGLISDGLCDKQIASALNVTYNTAKTHIVRITKKLKAFSKLDIVRFAIKNNLPFSKCAGASK